MKMENENKESRLKEYVNNIEKYESNPLIRNIFSGETSFKKVLENFYGISSYWLGGGKFNRTKFKIDKKSERKKDFRISELIDIISPFGEEINKSKLSFNQVREVYKSHNKSLVQLRKGFIDMFYLFTKGQLYSKKPEEYEEFCKLHNAAINADDFIKNDYEKYLEIKQLINKEKK